MNATVQSVDSNKYVTVREAAQIQKVSEITIRRKLWKKQLKRFRVGGRTLLLAAEVMAQITEA